MKFEQESDAACSENVNKHMTNTTFTVAALLDPVLHDEMAEPQWLFRALFEQAAVAIAYIGLDGKLLRVNQCYCDIVGYTREELLDRTFFWITHPDDREASRSALQRMLNGEMQNYRAEKRYLHKDGSCIWTQLTSSLIRDPAGTPKYFISIFQDITARKLAEAERAQVLAREQVALTEVHSSEKALREAKQRMNEFISITSHELKSPLTVVSGNIQLAIRYLQLAQDSVLPMQKNTLDTVTRLLHLADLQASRINRLASDLLDFSRIHAGKMKICLKTWNLVSIVCAVVEEQRVAHPKRIFHVELPTQEIVPIIVDADRIGQVMTNYLANAVKYSPVDKPIEVKLSLSSTTAHIAVHDEGPGLPKDQHERVWERFYQVQGIKECGGAVTGLGLGLYISKMIIEEHQGQVGVESVPGKGTTFWFTLPLPGAAKAQER
jgi:PAS domain S-box-containing protein